MNPLRKLKNIKESTMKKKRHIAIVLTVLITSATCIADNEILAAIRMGNFKGFQNIDNATFNQLPIAQLQQHLRLARAESSSLHSHATALRQSGMQRVFSHLTNFFLGSVQNERTRAETKRADLDQIIESLHGKVQAALALKQRRDTEYRYEIVNNALEAERGLEKNRGTIANLTAGDEQAELAAATANLTTLYHQMEELGTLYITKASEVSTVQDSLTTANASLEEKDGELTNLRSQLETEKSRLQQELERRMAAATEEEMVSVGTSCDDLGKRAYAQLKKECEQTRAELQRITHEKNALETQVVNPGLDENGQLERIRTLESANHRYEQLVKRAGDQIVRLRALNEAFQKELGATRFEEIKRKTAAAQKEAQEALAKSLAQRNQQIQDLDDENEED